MKSSIGALLRERWLQICVCVCVAGILAVQVLLPGFIGLANNGDFVKVTAWLKIAPTRGWAAASYFWYFNPDYTRLEKDPPPAAFISSEVPLGFVALLLQNAKHDGAHFDIRVLGAIHATIYLAGFALLAWLLGRTRRRLQIIVAAAAVFFFTDVVYVAYFNSFYMDTPAICALLLLVTSAVCICIADEPSMAMLFLYGVATLLFVTSKSQHGMWAPILAILPVTAALRWRRLRWTSIGVAATIIAACGLMLLATPKGYQATALYNVLFYRLGARGVSAMPDLREIGLTDADVPYLGKHAFIPGSPIEKADWTNDFYWRTGYGRLLRWYASHPIRTAMLLDESLTNSAPEMRQKSLSNYRREEGHVKAARTNRFAAWSNFRAWLFATFPHHIVIWYCIFITGAIAIAWRASTPAISRLAWLAFAVAIVAVGEFAVAALADAVETPRHLIVFHQLTDVTLCFALAWAGAALSNTRQAHSLPNLERSPV